MPQVGGVEGAVSDRRPRPCRGIDLFNRVVVGSAGGTWTTESLSNGTVGCNNGAFITPTAPANQWFISQPENINSAFILTMKVRIERQVPIVASSAAQAIAYAADSFAFNTFAGIQTAVDGSSGLQYCQLSDDVNGTTFIGDFPDNGGTDYYIKWLLTPTYHAGKVWAFGDPEPGWMGGVLYTPSTPLLMQVLAIAGSAHNAGGPYHTTTILDLISGCITSAQAYSIGGLTPPPPPAPIVTTVEDWGRVNGPHSWGQSALGLNWIIFTSGSPTYSVDGTNGLVGTIAGATRSLFGELQNPIAGTAPWADGNAFSYLARFLFTNVYATSNNRYSTVTIGFTRNDTITIAQFEAQINNFAAQNLYDMKTTNVTSAGVVLLGGWQPNIWYNVRMEIEPGVGARYKLWNDNQTEPVGWDEDIADPGIASNDNTASVELFVSVSNRTAAQAAAQNFKFGTLEVTNL